MLPSYISASEKGKLRLAEEVKATLPRNPDGSVDDDKWRDALAQKLTWDDQAERLKEADRVIARLHRPKMTEAHGQIMLPGYDTWGWEPKRMIADEDCRHSVEAESALPAYTDASARRKRLNAARVTKIANQETELASRHTMWANEQLQKGRKVEELTQGNFLREAGFWSATPIESLAEEEEPDPETEK